MVKTFLTVSLKDPQSYYMEDETIHCQVSFKSEKVLKEALIRVKFMGRSTSLSNSIKQHARNIFAIEKEIAIDQYNNTANVKRMNTIEFSLEAPSNHVIPSFRNLESNAEGGKIEYLVEATLEASGFLKKSVLATHIISVPLIGNVNINVHGLERTRESTMRWPKNEDDKNTCILYGWIPHEGILRGKDVPIRVEYRQPDRYEPIENITISLVQQEIISSAKDSPPNMTKQLPDRIIKKQENPVDLTQDNYSHSFKTSKVIVFSIPSDITPSIIEGGKVVRIDYKIRVTVEIPNGKKELSINLPVVVGTVGSVFDSGLELPHQESFNLIRSDRSHSSIGTTDLYPSQSVFLPSVHSGQDIYPPPSPGFLNPFNTQIPYPPPAPPPFLLNTQTMPFLERADTDVTKMPIPDLSSSNTPYYHPPSSTFYPPQPPFIQSPTTSTTLLNNMPGSIHSFISHDSNPSNVVEETSRSSSPQQHIVDPSIVDQIDTALSRMSTLTSTKNSVSADLDQQKEEQKLQMPFIPVLDKPNTPTPPLTPFLKTENSSVQTSSHYNSGLSMDTTNAEKTTAPTRIDPLNSVSIEK